MKCNNCGNEFEGNFCVYCGAKATLQENDDYFERAKTLLIDPTEKVKGILGNNYMQSFVSTGQLGNGFAVLTDKRIYFKGKCFFRKGKGFYSKCEEKTVDLNDVTGTGFVHNKATWAKVLHIIFAIMCGVVLLETPILMFSFGVGPLIGCLGNLLIWGGLSFLFKFLYNRYNYSVFEISYAGGGIAFDMHWITEQESADFQQQLVLLKQIKKEAVLHNTPQKPEFPFSVTQQLKEYKELLDCGIITQEEFDAKKKELLTQ